MGRTYGGTANSCDSAVRDPLLLICLAFVLLTVMIVVRLLRTKRGQTHVGCQLSFLASLWIVYLFGPLVYLIPGYCGVFPELMVPGCLVCLYCLAGFAAGSFLLPKLISVRPLKDTGPFPKVPSGLRTGLLVLGILFFVLSRVGAGFAGVQAIITGGQQLMVVAFVLNIWEAARKKDNKKVVLWLAASFLFPFETIVNSGFLGVGMELLAPVIIFATTCIGTKRNYFRLALVSGVVLYLGMSFFVTYAHLRGEIRATVWGGDRFSNRVDEFARIFTNFEFFSIKNPAHLDPISGRMNQAWLVGAGVTYMENTQEWARGETLKYAALGFVPRVLWKNKPQQGGNELVNRYTGFSFSEGTSVPLGQVLELYVNGGPWLVFLGFLIIGGMFAYLDVTGSNALKTGAFNTFIYCFVIGQAFHRVGGEFLPVTTNCAVGVFLVYALQQVMRMRAKRIGKITGRRIPRPAGAGYQNISVPVSRSGLTPY
jgi:hypothetical protein